MSMSTLGGVTLAAVAALATACTAEVSAQPRAGARMEPITWGTTSGGLRLGLSVPGANQVAVHLQNVGTEPLDVLSHVDAGEWHFDWYRLRLEDARGTATTLRLLDSRERSAAITVTLKPSESLTHVIDVAAWAKRGVNGGKPLALGSYRVWATYDVDKDSRHWRGHLEAGPIELPAPLR
jgi:hypothetical protein